MDQNSKVPSSNLVLRRRERENLQRVADDISRPVRMAMETIERQFGPTATGMSLISEHATLHGTQADAVVLDEEGNVIAQIETKIESRPPDHDPADEAADAADWDDLDD